MTDKTDKTDKTKVVKTDIAEELTEDEAKEIAAGRAAPPGSTLYGSAATNWSTTNPVDSGGSGAALSSD